MVSVEKQRKDLILALEVCNLYLNSEASSTQIADACRIPLSSVKRYLKTPEAKRDKYVELLSDVISEHDIDCIIDELAEMKAYHKKTTKYKRDYAMIDVREAERIYELYLDASYSVTDEKKEIVKNLVYKGESFRKIGDQVSISPSHAFKLVRDFMPSNMRYVEGEIIDARQACENMLDFIGRENITKKDDIYVLPESLNDKLAFLYGVDTEAVDYVQVKFLVSDEDGKIIDTDYHPQNDEKPLDKIEVTTKSKNNNGDEVESKITGTLYPYTSMVYKKPTVTVMDKALKIKPEEFFTEAVRDEYKSDTKRQIFVTYVKAIEDWIQPKKGKSIIPEKKLEKNGENKTDSPIKK